MSTTTISAGVAGPAATPVQRNLVLLTLTVMLATIMQSLDGTIANVALPYIQGSVSASQDQVNWVLTSYIVAAAIMTPLSAALAQRMGLRRLFLVAVAGFTVTSMLCGIATSLVEIVAYRLAQGAFGAALVPLSQQVLLASFPKEKQGSAMAMWGVGVMIGPVVGPVLGGWLTEMYSWRWVFFINLPFGVLAFLGILAFIPETEKREGGFDWFGFAMLALGVGSLQMMLDRGEQLDWFSSTEIRVEAVLAALGFYLFAVQMTTARRPFISLRLFRDRNVTMGLIFIFTVGLVMYASLALTTPFVQHLMGYPVIAAGLVVAPRGVGTMIAMMLMGRLIGRVDVRILLLTGFGTLALSLWQMAQFTAAVSQEQLVISGMIQGIGLGCIFVPLSTVTFSTVAADLRGEATGLFSLLRNLGSSIGIAIVTALLTRNTQINHAVLSVFATPFNAPLANTPGFALDSAAGPVMLDAAINQQAALIAYLDDFRLMMVLSLAVMPLVLLLRPAKAAGAPAEHVAID